MKPTISCAGAVKAVLAVTLTGCVSVAGAQVMRPTQAEKETAPVMFRAEVTGDPKFANFETKTTPPGVYPTTGPRDFSGVYTTGGMGGAMPAGGPAGGMGGAAPAGGPPGGMGGAAPAGGPPGGMGGALPAGGPAGGMGGATPGAAPGGGKPGEICVPSFRSGFPGGAYPTHIHMTADRLTVVSEANHLVRRIYIGGQHEQNGKPTYGGDSIAHWDGDTLVVETINIKGQEGTLVERIRKIDGGRSLENVSSTNGGAPRTSVMAWRPDLDWVEDICEDYGEAFGEGYL